MQTLAAMRRQYAQLAAANDAAFATGHRCALPELESDRCAARRVAKDMHQLVGHRVLAERVPALLRERHRHRVEFGQKSVGIVVAANRLEPRMARKESRQRSHADGPTRIDRPTQTAETNR